MTSGPPSTRPSTTDSAATTSTQRQGGHRIDGRPRTRCRNLAEQRPLNPSCPLPRLLRSLPCSHNRIRSILTGSSTSTSTWKRCLIRARAEAAGIPALDPSAMQHRSKPLEDSGLRRSVQEGRRCITVDHGSHWGGPRAWSQAWSTRNETPDHAGTSVLSNCPGIRRPGVRHPASQCSGVPVFGEVRPWVCSR